MTGIAQKKTINPYQTVQAETMSNQAGIQVRGLGDTVVTEIDQGDWLKVSGVHFSKVLLRLQSKYLLRVAVLLRFAQVLQQEKRLDMQKSQQVRKDDNGFSSGAGTEWYTGFVFFVFSGQAEMDSLVCKITSINKMCLNIISYFGNNNLRY